MSKNKSSQQKMFRRFWLLSLLIFFVFLVSGCSKPVNKIVQSVQKAETNADEVEFVEGTEEQLEQSEAFIVYESGANLDLILRHTNQEKNNSSQTSSMQTYVEPLLPGLQPTAVRNKYAANNFIVYGTESTQKLSIIQRAAMVKSYCQANGKLPDSIQSWEEILGLGINMKAPVKPKTVAKSSEAEPESQTTTGQNVAKNETVKPATQAVKPVVSKSASTTTPVKKDKCTLEAEELYSGKEKTTNNGTSLVINPLMEFDFKKKSEIFNLRQIFVNQYPQLARPAYQPSTQVFGQIQDGKPWWGIDGIACSGPGKNSIKGLSEESRFLVNPYLLVGITENNAHYFKGSTTIACSANYPLIISLFWHCSNKWAKVAYNVSTYMKEGKIRGYPDANQLYMTVYNARDYGFNYIYIDPKQMSGVSNKVAFTNLISLKQFIHTGSSCGYSGGCNNMSPSEPNLVLNVSSLPASFNVKLWKNKPANAAQTPDMLFQVEMR